MDDRIMPKLERNDFTDSVYRDNCYGEFIIPDGVEDVIEGINRAIDMEDKSAFLIGLANRLRELGVNCTEDDREIMLAEVKERYKRILGKTCPRTVITWCKGKKTPGTTNRANNYDLCMALEMDYLQTAVFFQKHFLTVPYNVKSRIDAVYLYCLSHNKPYECVDKFLESATGFVDQESAHTETVRIMRNILDINDDEAFLEYLSKHCYGNEQQYQKARETIKKEIEDVKKRLIKDNASHNSERFSATRLNSLTIDAIFGFKYQGKENRLDKIQKPGEKKKLPKKFLESLPDDVTLGQIINGDKVSYETLRKSLILFRFYNYYQKAHDYLDETTIYDYLVDFNVEIDNTLNDCGFAEIYVRHPFDCLIMYCAYSYDPVLALRCVFEHGTK